MVKLGLNKHLLATNLAAQDIDIDIKPGDPYPSDDACMPRPNKSGYKRVILPCLWPYYTSRKSKNHILKREQYNADNLVPSIDQPRSHELARDDLAFGANLHTREDGGPNLGSSPFFCLHAKRLFLLMSVHALNVIVSRCIVRQGGSSQP